MPCLRPFWPSTWGRSTASYAGTSRWQKPQCNGAVRIHHQPWQSSAMTRRRLILAIVAAVLFGMAWWLSLDRLSAEERLLVGTWTFDGKSGTGRNKMYLGPDRRCAFPWYEPNVGHCLAEWFGPWFVRDGAV